MSLSTTAAAPSSDITNPAGPRVLGLEFAVSGNWSAKLEYDYVELSASL